MHAKSRVNHALAGRLLIPRGSNSEIVGTYVRARARSYPGGCHSVVVTESAGLSRTSVPRGPVGPLSHPTGGIDCAGGDDATTRTTVVVVMVVVVVLGGYDGAGRPFLLDAPFHIETNPHNADH